MKNEQKYWKYKPTGLEIKIEKKQYKKELDLK